MCNSDITVQILEKAIEEESFKKKLNGGFLGFFSSSSQKKKQRVNQALPPIQNSNAIEAQPNSEAVEHGVVMQEMPVPRNRGNL